MADDKGVEVGSEARQLRLGCGVARRRFPEAGGDREGLVGEIGDRLQAGDVRVVDVVAGARPRCMPARPGRRLPPSPRPVI